MTALSEARAQLHELEAQRANIVADMKVIEQARVIPGQRAEANNKRRLKQTVVINAANEVRLASMGVLRAETYGLQAIAKDNPKPRVILDAITTGGIKINFGGGYGVSYTARGLSQRVRVPNKADVAAWDKARRARLRAEAALSRAQAAEKQAGQLAYDNGSKLTLEYLAADIAKAAVLTAELDRVPRVGQKEHELNRLIDGQFGQLTIAKRHVAHLAKKVDDPECSTCKTNAQRAAQTAERIATIKALPRRRWQCPDHGSKLAYFMRSERPEWVKFESGERQVPNAPLVYCPVDWKRYLDGKQLEADQAAAAKAEARKKARAPKEITFLCPNPQCGETSTSEVSGGEVACEACEVEYPVERVVKVKVAA